MAKTFVVHASSAQSGWRSGSRFFVQLLLPICLAILITSFLHSRTQMSSVVIVVGFALFFGIIHRSGYGEEGLEVALTVNHESVHISKSQKGKQLGNSVLIQRKDILDVVVNEVVLSHKVVSVIVLRCLKSSGHDGTGAPKVPPFQTLLRESDVTLQLAFPGVEMSYMQCLTMRKEMCRALDLKIAL